MYASKEDLAFLAMDRRDRTTDNTILVELDLTGHHVDEFAQRIRDAIARLKEASPRLASVIRGKRWVPAGDETGRFMLAHISEAELERTLQQLLNTPFETERELWRCHLFVTDKRNVCMIQAHHSLVDGVSFEAIVRSLFLEAFERRGDLEELRTPVRFRTPRKATAATDRPAPPPSQPFATGRPISGERRFVSRDLPIALLDRLCTAHPRALSRNDLVLASTMRALDRWQLAVGSDAPLGVYLPCNVRDGAGFGNGSSRIVVGYQRAPDFFSLCTFVYEQVRRSLREGTWHYPDLPMRWIPLFLFNWLIRLSSRFKNVDRGSLIVSTSDLQAWDRLFPEITDVYVALSLTYTYPMSLIYVLHQNRCRLVLTYNDGSLSHAEANLFLKSIHEELLHAEGHAQPAAALPAQSLMDRPTRSTGAMQEACS